MAVLWILKTTRQPYPGNFLRFGTSDEAISKAATAGTWCNGPIGSFGMLLLAAGYHGGSHVILDLEEDEPGSEGPALMYQSYVGMRR